MDDGVDNKLTVSDAGTRSQMRMQWHWRRTGISYLQAAIFFDVVWDNKIQVLRSPARQRNH
jgi:hypothetical protein